MNPASICKLGGIIFRTAAEGEEGGRQFRTLRDEMQMTWGHLITQGGQYWGRGIERPHRFNWIICWKDEPSWAEFRTDSRRADFLARFVAIASERMPLFNIDVTGPLMDIINSPVTEVSYFRLESDWNSQALQLQFADVLALVAERHLPGHRGNALAMSAEAGQAFDGVLFGGWDNVEAHMQLGDNDEEIVEKFEAIIAHAVDVLMMHVRFQRHIS